MMKVVVCTSTKGIAITTWRRIRSGNPNAIACGELGGMGREVIASFGSQGLWAYVDNVGWTKINNNSAETITFTDLDGGCLDELVWGFTAIGLWRL